MCVLDWVTTILLSSCRRRTAEPLSLLAGSKHTSGSRRSLQADSHTAAAVVVVVDVAAAYAADAAVATVAATVTKAKMNASACRQ